MSVKHASFHASAVLILLLMFYALGRLSPRWGIPDIRPQLIPATPFDYKIVRTGIFEMTPSPSHTADSVESLFFKARSFRYVADRNKDQWQTPQETEQRRAGDCEDKSVWLYTQLKQNGYSDVRLVIGKYRPVERRYHVWVSYEDSSGSTFLLDPSLQKRIWIKGRFSSGLYRPVYSFDGKNRYRHLTS